MGTAGVAERTDNLGLYGWEDGADLYNHIQLNENWVIIDSDVLKKSWSGTSDYANKIFISGTEGSSGTALSVRISTDTESRFNILAGGSVQWGSGATVVDTNLYREGTAVLATDSVLRVTSGTVEFLNGTVDLVATDTPTIKLSTDAWIGITRSSLETALTVTNDSAGLYPTFIVTAEGRHDWGSGVVASTDVSLYRSGVGTMTIEGDVIFAGSISFPTPLKSGWSVVDETVGVKSYNAGSVSLQELSDVVGNLINDLKDIGILGA